MIPKNTDICEWTVEVLAFFDTAKQLKSALVTQEKGDYIKGMKKFLQRLQGLG